MQKHTIVVIGCGSIGERHLRCLQRTGRADVAGVDTLPAIRAHIEQTYGAPTGDDWRAALRSGRHSAAVICTPAPLHIEMALEALQCGLHVLIEKPLSHSMARIDELLAARLASGRRVAVAYVYHVFPVLAAAKAFVAAGGLGPVLQAVVTTGQPFHRLRPAYANTYYRDRRMGGGAIQDALTHLANWMEGILGPTESVLCECAHLAVPGVTVEDTVHVSARHANALCHYSLNQFQAPNETYLQLNAAEASLRIELHQHRWGTFATGDSGWKWRAVQPIERDDHFIAQANAFLDYIEDRRAPACSLEAAIQTLRFNLAALASADSGARVACGAIS